MKKLLFLILATSYGLQAITPTYNYSMPENVYLEEIEPVTVQLDQESQSWVNTCGIVGAAAGAVVGFGACLVLPEHMRPHQQTEVSENLSMLTTGIVTAVASAATACASYLYARSCTPEKIEESKTNNLIYDHNNAVKAFNIVNLSAHERARLSRLPFKNPAIDNDRLRVYQGISSESSKKPINDCVNYVKGIALKLDNEKDAYTKLTAARIAQLRASSLVTGADQIAQTIEQQKECIKSLSALLPSQPMKNWYTYVEKNTPEFKAEKLQLTFDARYNQLRKDEENIKWYLARLAALYGYVFSQIDLSSSAWHFILADLSTNYSDTPEGRAARKRDIQETKNHISRLIQNYQNKIIDYNNNAIELQELESNIYSPIAQFVMSQGGSTKSIKGRKANRRLLEYNNYLNHSDGCALWNWIQSCFDN